MNSISLNKYIRKHLKPFLIENGFKKVTDRHYSKTAGIFDYTIEIKSVGKYFSEVTGWPPQSIHSVGGVFCNAIKSWHKKEYHFQVDNLCSINQTAIKEKLKSEPERKREDIWWIDDESNLEEIVNDLKDSISNYSFGFFCRFEEKSVDDMIAETKRMGGEYWKNFRLYYLYKFLNMEKEAEESRTKYITEGMQLGMKKDELLKSLNDE